jgi:Rps23 Pro-64 3,4-dihydroxylase Tpa1-like proline 4-hydroxylase
MISYLSTFIVGTIFLITGLIKAFSSKDFIFQNYRYGLFPFPTVPYIAIAFIGLETALGVALILHEFPQWIIPSSIVLLVALSILNYWSTSTGRTEDCGCYGGVVIITPQQSLLLNLGYIALLIFAWFNPIPNHQTQTWQWILALTVMVDASIFGWHSRKQPIFDFNRLKEGNRWKKGWLKNSPYNLQQDSYFIVFFSQTCGYCKRLVPFLNMMQTQKSLPQVLGILSINDEEIEAFKMEQRARFPIISMDKLLFRYMADAFPTAALIENGQIVSKWIGEIPPEFLDKIKQSYQAAILGKSSTVKQPEYATVGTSQSSNPATLPESPPKFQAFLEKTTQFSHSLTANYFQIDNFLTPEEQSKLLACVLEQKSTFIPATTTTGELNSRQALVLYSYSFPEFSNLIETKIQTFFPDILSKLDLPSFSIGNIDSQLTAHNDGDYFKIHNDNGSSETNTRVLTYVYYFNQEPKAFSGGELQIYDSKIENNYYVASDSFQKIEPQNNRIVFFLSRHFHEVLPVKCPSQDFADSRFTINGWIRW